MNEARKETGVQEMTELGKIQTKIDLFITIVEKDLLEDAEVRKESVTEDIARGIDEDVRSRIEKIKKYLDIEKNKDPSTWENSFEKLDNGRYTVLRRFSEGGMGRLSLAWDWRLKDLVVIKEMLPEFKSKQDKLDRFKREIIALDKIDSEWVIKSIDVIKMSPQEDDLGIVMRFVENKDLRDLLEVEEGQLESKEENFFDRSDIKVLDKKIAKIMIQVALGLSDIHKVGSIHRDLKPENLIFTKDGRIKILDFGIVGVDRTTREAIMSYDEYTSGRGGKKETKTRGLAFLTDPDARYFGNICYASPEALKDSFQQRTLSDLYSLGVIGYELLTGELPVNEYSDPEKHKTKSPHEVLWEKEHANFPDPNTYREDAKISALELIIKRLLNARPEKRPETAWITAELMAGAMVFHYPDVVKDEDFRYLFECIGEKPEQLRKEYEHWAKSTS